MKAKRKLKGPFKVTFHIIGEIIAGFVFAIIGAYIGYSTYSGDLFGMGKLVGSLVGFFVGYPIGVFLGIYFFGKILKIEGTLLESFMGISAAVVLFLFFAEPLKLSSKPYILFSTFIALFPLLGTMGYNYKLK